MLFITTLATSVGVNSRNIVFTMAEAKEPSQIQPVRGLVELMTGHFETHSRRENALFELVECARSLETDFYHYGCCGEDDTGWGCAYRALQTVFSGILTSRAESSNKGEEIEDTIVRKMEGIKLKETLLLPEHVPSIKDIQHSLSITKPKQWIDPDYAHTYLSKFGVKGRVENLWGDKDEIAELPAKILAHFRKEALPIMIDDVIYAYTLVGYAKINTKPDTLFTHSEYVLVLDPHAINRFTYKEYRADLEILYRTFSDKNRGKVELILEGIKYEGDVFGSAGVFWLPFDVMFSKGTHKHWKVYFPSK